MSPQHLPKSYHKSRSNVRQISSKGKKFFKEDFLSHDDRPPDLNKYYVSHQSGQALIKLSWKSRV